MILFGIPSTVANGTNRIAIIAQALPATFVFFKKGYKDIKQSLYIAIALIPGAVLGALAGVRMPDFIFNKILAFIMIIVAVSMAIRKYRHKNIYHTFAFSNNLKRKPLVYIMLIGIGFYGGFIHVGIGFFTNVCPQFNRRNEFYSNKYAQSNCSGTLFYCCTNRIFFRLINFMVGRNCTLLQEIWLEAGLGRIFQSNKMAIL